MGEPSRRRSIAKIVVFDLAGPIVTYNLLRRAGLSTVGALVISGIPPAGGVVLSAVQRRRVDVVGVLVLGGIAVGTVLGLTTHSAHLVLLEGSVPTALLGLACVWTLPTQRPLMLSFALEYLGPDSARGRHFAGLWCYPAFRRALRVITAVWAVGFLAEAAVRVAVVEATSTSTALAVSKVLPYAVLAVLGAWTAGYGRSRWRRCERAADQTRSRPAAQRAS